MTIALPTALPQSGTSWGVADWRPVRKTTAPAVRGVAQLVLDTLPADELWIIDHAVVACTSTSSTRCRFYENSVSLGNLIDGSDAGNFVPGDWPAGLVVFPSTALLLQWTGASDGAVGMLNAQVRILRKG